MNQPLNAAIQTGLGNVFSSTPLAILQPRTAIAWQFESNSVLRAGFGVFSDILPGSIADVVGVNPPYVKTFQGGLLGTVGGAAIAPGVPNSAIDAAVAANQDLQLGISAGPAFLRVRASESCNLSSSRRHHGRARMENFMRRTSWSGVLAWSINSGPRGASTRNTWARAL